MQLYAGMDVGTAKITPAERRGVPHHLLDVWPVTRAAAVAEYQGLARAAFAEVSGPRTGARCSSAGRGCTSGPRWTTCGSPGPTPAVRARWEAEGERVGAAALHARLREADPAAAGPDPAQQHPAGRAGPGGRGDHRPAVRGVHARAGTGVARRAGPGRRAAAAAGGPRPARRGPGGPDVARRLVAGGRAPRSAQGLARGRPRPARWATRRSSTCSPGGCSEAEARARTVTATRRLVRRQESWFGADPDVVWLDAGEPGTLARLVALVRSRLVP